MRALVVLTGTGVPGGIQLKLGRLRLPRLPLAELLYSPMYFLDRNVHVISLPELGFNHPDTSTYCQVRDRILSLMGEKGYTQVDIVAQSQGAIAGIRFCLEYPELVGKFVSICGPFKGSEVARKWLRVFKAAGVKGLTPESRYLLAQAEIRQAAWDAGLHLPEIHAMGLATDRWVKPFDSALLDGPGVFNYCLGPYPPSELPQGWLYQRTSSHSGHITLLWDPAVIGLIKRVLRQNPATLSALAA